MLRVLCSLVVGLSLVAMAGAQNPDAQQAPAGSQPPAQAQQPATSQGEPAPGQQSEQKKPNRIKGHFKSWCINIVTQSCFDLSKPQQPDDSAQQTGDQQSQRQQLPPPNPRPPRTKGNDEESSSSDTKIDLSPPANDATHPGAAAGDDVSEFHVYDPHKADKDVEVGDFYFKRKNYPAAISRYESALKWKPNDAIATFRLAQALEKTGQLEDARRSYESYLKILPNGPSAEDARKAVQRLTLQSESRHDTPDKRR